MHDAMHRIPPHAIAGFVITLTLASFFPTAVSAQDDQAKEEKNIAAQIQELVTNLEAREAELQELGKKIERDPDSATTAMLEREVSERRGRFRRDLAKLVELVLTGEDAGAEVAQGRATAARILKADAPSLKDKLAELGAKNVTLIDTISKGPPEEVHEARKQFIETISASTRLLKYFQANLDLRDQLGLDTKSDTALFAEALQQRANVNAGALIDTKKQIDEIAGRPGVDQDAEAQKELADLRKQLDQLADSQRVNVDLMDKYGLDTAELKQGIISATGKLSQDILDKEVATGLIESSAAAAADWLRTNGTSLLFRFVTFLLVLFAFWIVARIARGAVRRVLDRSKLDVSSLAKDFFIKMTSRLVMLIGIIVAIAQLGVEVGPLLAGLGIAGFVIGFALQDTLSNFASGMMILVYRPFDVGDAVEAGGVTGTVNQMNLVSTMILTFDNQLLIVPNKQVWSGIIRNITHQDERRVDMTFGIGYSDDIPKAEKVLTEIVTSHEKVLKEPGPVVRLHTLGDSSVDFVVRPWSKTGDYWDVYWDVTREVKRRFDEEGISIPFPQRDVHVYREEISPKPGRVGGGQRSDTDITAQTPVPGEDEDA